MAGRGRIYQRGRIYYIAYRWDGREYRESARSADVTVAHRLLTTRLAERQGRAASGALTFDALAAWYLDDYTVRRLRTLDTARGRGGEPAGDVRGLAGDDDHDRSDSAVSADAAGRGGGGGDGE